MRSTNCPVNRGGDDLQRLSLVPNPASHLRICLGIRTRRPNNAGIVRIRQMFATVASWVVGLIVGVVFAVLSYFFYLFGVALFAGCIGYSLAVGLMWAIGFEPELHLLADRHRRRSWSGFRGAEVQRPEVRDHNWYIARWRRCYRCEHNLCLQPQ